ncbi:hypothetical protein GCM10011322_25000 [Salinarimonas ramus]|uniref:Uncharacterized protein n=1 Tax=Salinarimonas ramus TaxID=690164 RepID=A0A917Q9X3_9HYPH|nr:hypothetical protein GCM10011322_25000 [Salinarimonas ramus]
MLRNALLMVEVAAAIVAAALGLMELDALNGRTSRPIPVAHFS